MDMNAAESTLMSESTLKSDLVWKEKYLSLRTRFKEQRRRARDQQANFRQLLETLAAELAEKEQELRQVREEQNSCLGDVCAEVLALQASLKREQTRIERIVQEKDEIIRQRDIHIENITKNNQISSENKIMPTNNFDIQTKNDAEIDKNANTTLNIGSKEILCNKDQPLLTNRRAGSFRQFKKNRQQSTSIITKTSLTSPKLLIDSEKSEILANRSSSGSESSSPCSTPRSKPPLRLTLSSSKLDTTSTTQQSSNVSPIRSILKGHPSVSSSNLDASESSKSRIIEELQRLIEAKGGRVDERSCDSGRESDETDNVGNKEKFVKILSSKRPPPPPPPPRARTTRLSKDKHVSFEKDEQRAIRMLDESIHNKSNIGNNNSNSNSKSASIVWVGDGQIEHFL